MAQGIKKQLTARGLAALKPGEWANDAKPHGAGQLQARKLAGGDVAFYYRYTGPERTQVRLPLGTEITLAEAREKAGELSRRYQAGERDLRAALDADQREADRTRSARAAADAAAAVKAQATLGALMNAYVAALKAAGKVSAGDVEKAVALHIKKPWPVLWNSAAGDLNLDDLLPVIARVAQAGKLREAGKIRSYVRAAYSAAIRARQSASALPALRELNLSSNPARDLATIDGGSGNARQRTLSVVELRAYWARIKVMPAPDGPLLRFHLLTGGQRITQLGRVTMDDFDADSASIRIRDPKGRRQSPRLHDVPLIPEAIKAMKAMEGGKAGPYLFTLSLGLEHATYDMLKNRIEDVIHAMDEAGELERGMVTPGDLRRTVETRLAALGTTKEERAQLQSHGLSGVQNRHYDRHDYLAEKRLALETFYHLLIGKPGNVTPIRKRKAG